MSKKVRVRATAKQMHDGRTILVGQEFETDEKEASDLVAMQFAQRIIKESVPHIDESVPSSDEPPRGRYHRRDLRAEE